MTQLYLAVCEARAMQATFKNWDWVTHPVKFLMSFASIRDWYKLDELLKPTKTMLDSGAFTELTTGKKIDLNDYIAEAQKEAWNEVAALDVVGNPGASYSNSMSMAAGGIRAMPTFHYGEDWSWLEVYKNEFGDRIGLGGLHGGGLATHAKSRWLEQCFARAYPCRFHGFGISKEEILMALPFYSADTASWWNSIRFGNKKPSKGRSAYPDLSTPRFKDIGTEAWNLGHEVLFYLEREKRLQERWKSELAWAQEVAS